MRAATPPLPPGPFDVVYADRFCPFSVGEPPEAEGVPYRLAGTQPGSAIGL